MIGVFEGKATVPPMVDRVGMLASKPAISPPALQINPHPAIQGIPLPGSEKEQPCTGAVTQRVPSALPPLTPHDPPTLLAPATGEVEVPVPWLSPMPPPRPPDLSLPYLHQPLGGWGP